MKFCITQLARRFNRGQNLYYRNIRVRVILTLCVFVMKLIHTTLF